MLPVAVAQGGRLVTQVAVAKPPAPLTASLVTPGGRRQRNVPTEDKAEAWGGAPTCLCACCFPL